EGLGASAGLYRVDCLGDTGHRRPEASRRECPSNVKSVVTYRSRVCLSPHSAHALADIHLRKLSGAFPIRRAWRHWPYLAFKEPQKMIWNEARARGVDMTIATGMLTMREEALRDDQVKIVLGSRHGDIEKPPLFFQLSRCAGAQIRWHTAIDDVQRIDR